MRYIVIVIVLFSTSMVHCQNKVSAMCSSFSGFACDSVRVLEKSQYDASLLPVVQQDAPALDKAWTEIFTEQKKYNKVKHSLDSLQRAIEKEWPLMDSLVSLFGSGKKVPELEKLAKRRAERENAQNEMVKVLRPWYSRIQDMKFAYYKKLYTFLPKAKKFLKDNPSVLYGLCCEAKIMVNGKVISSGRPFFELLE